MAYKGQTDTVLCSKGGLTGSQNIDDILSYMMLSPSRNINMEKNGRRKRGGTALVNASAYAGTPKILGLYEAYFESGVASLLAATSDGDIYKNDTDKIATGLGTTKSYSMVMGENKVFIADGVSLPQVWTGAGNAAAVAEPAADFSTNPIFQMLLHERGASKRMLALNPKTLFFSATYAAAGDMEKFVTGAEFMYVDTGEGYGLVGMAEFGGEIFLFGKKKAYRIDDSDSDPTNWGYVPAAWNGGVANWHLLINTPNDLVCMADDGEIYSVAAVTSYGDYKQASLTRGSWMHGWIKENVKLSSMDSFHGIYDPVLRAVKIFVVRSGMTNADTCLLYFIDRESTEAWMVHDNQSAASGYNAASSCVGRSINGSYVTYTGDYSGQIWKLNQTNRSDNSNGYYAGFKTPNMAMDNPRIDKLFNRGRVMLAPTGDYNLQIRTWINGSAIDGRTISLAGGGVVLGTFMLDTDILGGDSLIEASFSIGRVGKRVQYELYNSGADEDFFISGLMTDWKPMGSKEG